jgi:hypothetical protein
MPDLKFAVTIGSFGLPSFVDLNITLLRSVFGDDVPILVSDDLSQWSPQIKEVADRRGVSLYVSPAARGHFLGDWQAVINAVEFSRINECDVAIKISQRFLLTDRKILPILEGIFSDPNVILALPGRPGKNRIKSDSKWFSKLPILTDILFLRTPDVTPEFLMENYQDRVRTRKDALASLVEAAVYDLMLVPWAGKARTVNELTEHFMNQPHYYLRRYQDPIQLYQTIAERNGVSLTPVLSEWARILPRYNPRPLLV